MPTPTSAFGSPSFGNAPSSSSSTNNSAVGNPPPANDGPAPILGSIPVDATDSLGSQPVSDNRVTRMKRMLAVLPTLSVPDDAPSNEETATNAAETYPMSVILPFMWLGSWRDAKAADTLQSAGITHVLDLAKESEARSAEELAGKDSAKYTYLSIPMNDDQSENLLLHLGRAHAFINNAKQTGGSVLVHCRRGISRSAAVVVSYLMRFEDKSYEDSVVFVKERRACISLNLGFRMFLEHWRPEVDCPVDCTVNCLDPS